jgi:putative transposase
MLANHRLAQAIGDAAWAEFGRQLRYKQGLRGGEIETADQWYPSSQFCSHCGARNTGLKLADRVFTCACGHSVDRDLNAAVNLAQWAEAQETNSNPRTTKHGGRVTNARRREGADRHPARVGETGPNDAGTDVRAAPAA